MKRVPVWHRRKATVAAIVFQAAIHSSLRSDSTAKACGAAAQRTLRADECTWSSVCRVFEGVGIAHADPIRSDGYHLDVLQTLARWVCCMLWGG
jgi:hypothetical protein